MRKSLILLTIVIILLTAGLTAEAKVTVAEKKEFYSRILHNTV